ncbi:MAG: alpha/beta hydrolase [Tenacibaculum sp.]
MSKTPLYFVPGLAANSKIFEGINLSKEIFEYHFLEWLLPKSIDETLPAYAERMCDKIKHKSPILIGVSFGGVIVQEMSKIICCKKIIIISSIKSNKELPLRLKLVQATKAYKLFPVKAVSNIEKYEQYFFNDFLKKRAKLYKEYLSVRNEKYLHWAIHQILHWQQTDELDQIIHIHGDKDEIFPIKNIKKTISIKNGTHIMILNKAKIISDILSKECSLSDN